MSELCNNSGYFSADRIETGYGDRELSYRLFGGVRYAPVVRYNKVHVYMAPEDIREAVRYLGIKEVESGANMVIYPLGNDSYIKDCRIITGDMVVSPLQADTLYAGQDHG